MIDGKPNGYNARYPRRDKLWNETAVKKYVALRHHQSINEKTEAKRERNRRHYRSKKAKYDQIKAQTKADLDAGKITPAQAQGLIDQHAVGWYKTIRDLRQKVNEAEAGSVGRSEAEAELKRVEDQSQDMANSFQSLNQTLHEIFSGKPQRQFPLPCLSWPTERSISAYLRIVALTIPMRIWPPDPATDSVRKSVIRVLHPDKEKELSEYITKDERDIVTAIFNASSDILFKEVKEVWPVNKLKKAEFLRTWATTQQDVQEGFLPQSDKFAPFVFRVVMEDVARAVASDQDPPEDQEDHDG